jgi:hypothetical protein
MTREDQLVHLSAAVLRCPAVAWNSGPDAIADQAVEVAAKILERIERVAYRHNNYPG